MIVLDSSSWKEFFIGSDKGAKIKEFIEKESVMTNSISLAEIADWARRNGLNESEIVMAVRKSSEVLTFSNDIAELAGKINSEKNIGIANALVYATASVYGLKVLSCNETFRSLENVEVI